MHTAIERHMDPQRPALLGMVEEGGTDYGRSWWRDPEEHRAFTMKGKPRSRRRGAKRGATDRERGLLSGYTGNGNVTTGRNQLSLGELRDLVWPERDQENRKAYDLRYVRLFGTSAGLLLSQLVYWSDKGHDPDQWIYKTKDEIIEEFGLGSRYEVDQARHRLEEEGVLETERRPRRGWRDGEWRVVHPSPVLHYRVDLLALAKRLEDLEQSFEQSRVSHAEDQDVPTAQSQLTSLKHSNGRGSTARIEHRPAFESEKAGRSYTQSTDTDNVAKKNGTKSSPIQGGAGPGFAGSAPQVNQERIKQLNDDMAAMMSNWRMEDDPYRNDITDPSDKPRRAGTYESNPYEP